MLETMKLSTKRLMVIHSLAARNSLDASEVCLSHVRSEHNKADSLTKSMNVAALRQLLVCIDLPGYVEVEPVPEPHFSKREYQIASARKKERKKRRLLQPIHLCVLTVTCLCGLQLA